MIQSTLTSKRTGFTLVEILVVIAILGLLSALLFAAFARVREKGRSASCQSNLRQIALAMQQYVGDNDGTFPAMWFVTDKDTPKAKMFEWKEVIMPYAKSDAIFRCPSSNVESPNDHVGYNYNWLDLNKIVWSPNRDPKKNQIVGQHEANFDALADVVLNYDVMATKFDGSMVDGREIESSCGPMPASDLHSGGANFAYGDGHVKWLSRQQQGEWICGVNERSRVANGN